MNRLVDGNACYLTARSRAVCFKVINVAINDYFLSTEQFKAAIENDELIEYEEVYPGRYYGTLRKEIERICGNGNNAILDIDVKGAVNVMKQFGADATSIFIKPPSIDALRHRLLSRGTKEIEAINQRVSKAEYELSFADRFAHVVVNDVLRTAIDEVHAIIKECIEK